MTTTQRSKRQPPTPRQRGRSPEAYPQTKLTKHQDKRNNQIGRRIPTSRQLEVEVGKPRGDAPEHQMGVHFYNVEPRTGKKRRGRSGTRWDDAFKKETGTH
ncbi:hypothetical protein ANN_23710 [Periplaneta americana]|uniref:Uncharacterized protein n=1 Tax=Periplaneta americana TaxID=6978 RepID=A0ABQ8SLT7_PERAM|nr:hypothetical protein ANN_23710 [Periplaneta americana]